MMQNRITDEINRLIKLMATLRSEQGCPWDRQQTASSLKPYLLEETYELLEAIDHQEPGDIQDELGDLLLQVVFLARIFQEQDSFDLGDVAATISDKLVRRHPHVFADADVDGHAQRWEEIKRQERSRQGKHNSLSARLPKQLPALKRAAKVSHKLAATPETELRAEIISLCSRTTSEPVGSGPGHAEQRELLSNLLFTVVRLCTRMKFDPEDLLREETARLITEIESKNDPSICHQLPSR